MKSLKIFLFVLLVSPLHLFAQDLDCRFFEWTHALNYNGSGQIGIGYSPIITDTSGNSFYAGQFSGSLDFGNINLTASGGIAVFISKIDFSGQTIWATKAYSQSGMYEIEIVDIKIDQQGNSYIIGSFLASAQFGSFSFSAPLNQGYQGFYAKLNAQGEFVQAIQLGTIPTKIDLDALGYIYILGNLYNPINLGSISLSSNGYSDMFIAKMNQQGQFIWAKQYGGLSHDYGIDIAVDPAGNSYFTGIFKGQVNFENIILNNLENACFIAKLNSNGQLVWANHINNSNSSGRSLTIDSIGNSYIIGTFMDTMQINGQTLTSTNSFNTFVAKINNQGEFIDVIKIKDNNNVTASDFNVSSHISLGFSNESIYISSLFYDSLIVNGIVYGVNPQHNRHVYFAELNTGKLDLKWVLTPNGNSNSNTGGISSDLKGNCYAAGLFHWNSLIFANDTLPGGTFEKPSRYLTKIAGIDNTVLILNDTLTAVQTNVNYQWLDCANNMAAIPGATFRTFYPTVAGQYAVALSNDFCTDTSICMQVTDIDALAPLQKVGIYPNPASSQITISSLPLGSSINLYDVSGRMLQTHFNKEKSSVRIPVQDLAEGLYFLEIVKDVDRVFKKVVLMKK